GASKAPLRLRPLYTTNHATSPMAEAIIIAVGHGVRRSRMQTAITAKIPSAFFIVFIFSSPVSFCVQRDSVTRLLHQRLPSDASFEARAGFLPPDASSESEAYATLTSTAFGLAFSLLGRCTFNTPSLNSALTFTPSAPSGSMKLRVKLP